MIDTIVCKLTIERVFDVRAMEYFRYSDGVKDIERFVYQSEKPDYAPRLTYRRDVRYASMARLEIEFAVSKLLPVGVINPTQEQIDRVLEGVDRWLRVFLGHTDLPSICTWHVIRIDYVYDFSVGTNMIAYMKLVQSLRYRNLSKQLHGNTGVTWVSKSRRRAVKFYDKSTESKKWSRSVLRFEISNYHDSLDYMCSHWFKCERTVGAMAQHKHALYVLHYAFNILGLQESSIYNTDDKLLMALHECYAGRSAVALHVLAWYKMLGVDAYKRGYVRQGTYHTWVRTLKQDGFIGSGSGAPLPPLLLPQMMQDEK